MRHERVFVLRPLVPTVVAILSALAVLFAGGRAYGGSTLLVQQATLLAADPVELAGLGSSVAISGDTVVGGAPSFLGAGAAYLFVKTGAGCRWQQQKLTASDTTSPTDFGWSVAISGDTMVAGSPFEAGDSSSILGAAYVFVKSGTNWSLQQRLTPTSNDTGFGSYFGFAVAISGDTIVVGHLGDFDGVSSAGTASVFVRNGTSWRLQQKLIPNNPSGGFFGYSVALDGETALVGDSTYGAGSAYVFTRSGSSWTEQQKLTASDTTAGVNFGYALALDGETLVVSDPFDDAVGYRSGSAYVFVKNGASWSHQQRLIPADPVPQGDLFGKQFGGTVALSGDTIVAGAVYDSLGKGAAYVFGRSGASWNQRQKLTNTDPATGAFGASVALSGGTAAIGSGYGQAYGAVYIFGSVSLEAAPNLLWPPNHEMVPVTLALTVTDACDPAPSCAIESVTSNELIDGDFSIKGPLRLELRAERLSSGPGRTYSILVECRDDASGNVSTATVEVLAPHDQARPPGQ